MFCPAFIYDVAVARTVIDFLSGEIDLISEAKKFSDGLSEAYETPILPEELAAAGEEIVRFLSDIDAADQAVELLNDFSYYRLYFASQGKERKIKPLFGAVEDAVKVKEYEPKQAMVAFKAYVFGLRSNVSPKSVPGWDIKQDENLPMISELCQKEVSVFDLL